MFLDYISMPVYGIIAGLMASIPLGPIGVLCIQRTLGVSHRAGFVSGIGAATADTIFATLAIFALVWVNGFIARYEIWVEAIGGLLIVVFGLTIFLKKIRRPGTVPRRGSDLSNFSTVLFVTLPNPAYFLVFVTIFAAMGVGGAEATTMQKWMIVMGVFIGGSAWWFLLTWVVNKFRKKFTLHSLWWMNKISGGLIMLLGAYAVCMVIYKLIEALIATGKI
ncbi:MAG: LysE family transporter [Mucinivorans sp.]